MHEMVEQSTRSQQEVGHVPRRSPSGGGGVRRGVVFVHGVGDQRKSDTLIDFGEPLLDWLVRWYADRGEPAPRVGRVELSFATTDIGAGDSLPRATVEVWNGESQTWEHWVWAEAWWATSSRRAGFQGMVRWSVRYWWRAVGHLLWATGQRWERLLSPREGSSDPNRLARFVDLVNTLGLLGLYTFGAVIGYFLVLLPLFALAQVPFEPLRDFVLVRLLRPFLEINAGEFRTYIEDDLQAGNMRRRVADAVTTLAEEDGCTDVTLIAHSEGAVVSFGMLVDGTYCQAHESVSKLITLGAGLNLTWTVEQELPRLHGPIPDRIHWLDIWASYDPVPSGWLRPPRIEPDGHRRAFTARAGRDERPWAPIFRPTEELATLQRLRPKSADPSPYADPNPGPPEPVYWPMSEQVTNEMNLLADHGAYWKNAEQVLVRLAAEIDRDYYQDSRFWRGDCAAGERTKELRAAVEGRRVRVTWLAACRALIIAAWLAVCVLGWGRLGVASYTDRLARWLREGRPDLPIISEVQRLLQWLHEQSASFPGPLPLVGSALELVYWLLAAVVLGLPFMLVYVLVVRTVWDRWDRRARGYALRDIARACRAMGSADQRAAIPSQTPGMPASATKVD